VSPEERDARYHQIMLPYQTRVGAELVALRAVGPVRIVSMHTCTKQLRGGTFRPWQVGVISGVDERMRRQVFEHLQVAAKASFPGGRDGHRLSTTVPAS
jgi:predicted N-formylglutamate amidohydrolase